MAKVADRLLFVKCDPASSVNQMGLAKLICFGDEIRYTGGRKVLATERSAPSWIRHEK
jgi:hypothetical protein